MIHMHDRKTTMKEHGSRSDFASIIMHTRPCHHMQSGGPSWGVLLGRLDGKTSDFNGSLDLPAPTDNLTVLQQKFSNLSLNDVDLVALSGTNTTSIRLDLQHIYTFTTYYLPCHLITACINIVIYLNPQLINYCRGAHVRPGSMPVHHGPSLQLQRDKHAGPDPRLNLPGVPHAEVPEERQRFGPG